MPRTRPKPLPRYLLLQQALRGEIDRMALGDRLPTQHELMERTGFAYETVSRALRALAEEGLIRRCRRRGTFVLRRPGDLHGSLSAWLLRGDGSGAVLRDELARLGAAHPLLTVEDASSQGGRFAASDVVQATSTSFLFLAPGFAPLSGEVERDASAHLDARILDLVRIDGRLYGAPVVASPQVLHVNEDLLDTAGVRLPDETRDRWDWDALLACARAVHNAAKNRFGWASPRDLQTLAPFVWQNGGRLFDLGETRCELDRPRAHEALAFWRELESLSPLAPASPAGAAKRAFLDGRVAFFPYGGMIEADLRRHARFRRRARRLPGARCEATTVRFTALAIRRQGANDRAAEAFLKRAMGPRVQASLLERGCLLPARRERHRAEEARPYLRAFESARPYVTRATVAACTVLAAGLGLLWEDGADTATVARQLALMADAALRDAAHGLGGLEPEI